MSSFAKGKGGKNVQTAPPEPVLTKAEIKALKKKAEEERLAMRDKLETMTLDDNDELNAFSRMEASCRANELALGAGGGYRDSFGNTLSKAQHEAGQKGKEIELERKAARERREAKARLEAESSSSATTKRSTKSLTPAEDYAQLQLLEQQGTKLSNQQLKRLKAHREDEREAREMAKEFESGLKNFTLSVSSGAMDEQGGSLLSQVDVIIPSFTITAPHKTLFLDAELRLVKNCRYGLIAPNGAGKSTLLKFIAQRRLPIPSSMSMLIVEQEVMASDLSLVEQVMGSDSVRRDVLERERVLLEFIESHGGGESEDEDGYEEEEEVEGGVKGGTGTGTRPTPLPPSLPSSFTLSEAVTQLQAIGSEIDSLDLYSSESRARRILSGLGFIASMLDKSSMTLSGGWRMRVALAKALFCTPALLLLDEPTSHLDLDAVLWLEQYLSEECTSTLVIVSHDVDFLDSTVTHILHVDQSKIHCYTGNVNSFRSMKGQIVSKNIRDYNLQQKILKEVLGSGVSSKKAEERVKEKLGVSSLIQGLPKEYLVKFSFEGAGDSFPSISLLDCDFRYPGMEPLFHNLRFSIHSASRVAIVGANGSGKSTLLKLMTRQLEPSSGHVSHHSALRIGVYNQHFEDLLSFNMTPIQFLVHTANSHNFQLTELDARKYLGMFGLDGARHLIKIGELSGGQKARVVFASISIMRAHILILDEPTNFLDMESVEALLCALKEFQGGVVMVSHDARLIKNCECELWECTGGVMSGGISGTGVRVERGGFDAYRNGVLKRIMKTNLDAQIAAEVERVRRKAQRERRLLLGRGRLGGRVGSSVDAADSLSSTPSTSTSAGCSGGSSSGYKFKGSKKVRAVNVTAL